MTLSATPLAGRKGLVVGIANADSIATGCARAFREAGADLAVTYLNEKALKYVEPVATALEAPIVMPLDVTDEAQIDAVFARIASEWGRLDFLLHSIAYCRKDDLTGRVVDTSREGFAEAMDVSVHSLFRLLKRAEPLMSAGGSALTVKDVTHHESFHRPLTRLFDKHVSRMLDVLRSEVAGKFLNL